MHNNITQEELSLHLKVYTRNERNNRVHHIIYRYIHLFYIYIYMFIFYNIHNFFMGGKHIAAPTWGLQSPLCLLRFCYTTAVWFVKTNRTMEEITCKSLMPSDKHQQKTPCNLWFLQNQYNYFWAAGLLICKEFEFLPRKWWNSTKMRILQFINS